MVLEVVGGADEETIHLDNQEQFDSVTRKSDKRRRCLHKVKGGELDE